MPTGFVPKSRKALVSIFKTLDVFNSSTVHAQSIVSGEQSELLTAGHEPIPLDS